MAQKPKLNRKALLREIAEWVGILAGMTIFVALLYFAIVYAIYRMVSNG